MLVTVYEAHRDRATGDLVRLDTTRMAQGIMTGIGFLGARGLTTAASIWITAAIGILAGIGFYLPLVVSVVLTIGMLSVLRLVEARMPTQAYYHVEIRFTRSPEMTENALRALIESYGFSIANFSYSIDGQGRVRHHTMVLRSTDRSSASRLSERLEGIEGVQEFRIAPTGD